jgi:hypothetical protein
MACVKKDYATEEARAQQRAVEPLMNKRMNEKTHNLSYFNNSTNTAALY